MSSSSLTSSSGRKANKSGNQLEQAVADTLEREGYTRFWNHKAQIFTQRGVIDGKQYATQVNVGLSIYETKRACDLMVFNKDKFPDDLIIECKWQQKSGSVDEKYPFLYHNIVKTGVPTIVVLDGDGYKPKAKEWLKSFVTQGGPLISVYSLSEFLKVVNDGLL